MTTEQMLIAALAILWGVIVSLSLWFKAKFDKQEKRLEECEEDREQLWKTIAELRGQVCTVKNCDRRTPPEEGPRRMSLA